MSGKEITGDNSTCDGKRRTNKFQKAVMSQEVQVDSESEKATQSVPPRTIKKEFVTVTVSPIILFFN